MRDNGDGGKVRFTKESGVISSVPQIQELQNLMDSQTSKVEAIRASYSQQNTQLAKANSSLMMRLSELERKVGELVKENVSLRSTVSMGEFHYKKRLSEQLDVLENGISHRVEEIFHMFDRVRMKENLSPEPSLSRFNELKSILRNRRTSGSSLDGRKSANSIQFMETDDQSVHTGSAGSNETTESNDRQDDESSRKKRRKSSRRESIFLPTDFDFPYHEPEPEPEPEKEPEPEPRKVSDDVSEDEQLEPSIESHAANDVVAQDDNEGSDHAEASFNFTNSIIEYSIPEEVAPSTSAGTDQLSSSKIEVFRDEPEAVITLQKEREINDAAFVPLSTQNKVKHSMRTPGARGRSKIVDEVMPTTNNGSGACDIDFTRARRTRGKAIDYTLPSLRAKMRRPTEKFVDATTFTSIHELQVTNARKKDRRHQPRRSNAPITLKESVVDTPDNQIAKTQSKGKEETLAVSEATLPDQPKPLVAHKPESTMIKNKITFQDKPILKDITNKPKANKTRKLLKNAIINDICDTQPSAHDETFDSSGSNGSSFRLHEEDLSVFDLIGSNKVKPSNKTYRAKFKKMVTK